VFDALNRHRLRLAKALAWLAARVHVWTLGLL
jgi:hypothetical protein